MFKLLAQREWRATYTFSGKVRGHLWWGVWVRKERPSKSRHVGGLPIPPPTTTMCELTSPSPLVLRPGSGCQGHLSSPEWRRERQAPEHRVPIVPHPPGA